MALRKCRFEVNFELFDQPSFSRRTDTGCLPSLSTRHACCALPLTPRSRSQTPSPTLHDEDENELEEDEIVLEDC